VAVLADGPHVTIYDAEGKVRARWAVLDNVPALTFDDDGGRTRLGLAVTPYGPEVNIFDAQGRPLYSIPPARTQ
jgi:hypothetical protein